jgi:hypothetical protein
VGQLIDVVMSWINCSTEDGPLTEPGPLGTMKSDDCAETMNALANTV